MNWAFDITLKNRNLLENILENHNLEELNKVPSGFSNNIIWNIAHTIVTQQILVYQLSGLEPLIDIKMIEHYRKGTRAQIDVSQSEVNNIKELLSSTIYKTWEDYKSGKFKSYNAYTTSTKSTLTNVDEAIAFNNFHEGIHLGYILALRKSI